MKKITSIITMLLTCCSVWAGNNDIAIIKGLAERIIPEHARHFDFITEPWETDSFLISSDSGRIVIRGNSVNSMAVGLNYYLTNYCMTHITWWDYDKVVMPSRLPEVEKPVGGSSRVKQRFFLNYCTYGYTMVYWQWPQWERFIDWMALNGVNMPFALTGQESIWYRVWRKLGLTDADMQNYFTGPSFLPWHRMCNIDHWNGPLPKEWLDGQFELQKRILERERAPGMKPVLPPFSGHVPASLKRLYPKARITKVSKWLGFADENNCYFLDPDDPLFLKVQKLYMQEQAKEFGTDHIYGVDMFNEVQPPSWELSELKRFSNRIYSSMAKVDKEAIWFQMSWMFYLDKDLWLPDRIEAFLSGVPKGRLVMLDYFSDNVEIWRRSDKFHGQDFIWSYLGNFGGNTMLAGNPRQVSCRIDSVCREAGENLKGLGCTPEGLDCNEFMYEFVLSKAWNLGFTVDSWIENHAYSRAGSKSALIADAWRRLVDDIYVHPSTGSQATLTNARPCLKGYGFCTTVNTIDYSNKDLLKIWREMLSENIKGRNDYTFDIVNLGRQVLGNHFTTLRDSFALAYEHRDIYHLNAYGKKMIELLNDLDDLLACEESFTLDRWIKLARDMGDSPELKDYYEKDARLLITKWSDTPAVTDYANRSLSTLTREYYLVRWARFIDEVTTAAVNGVDFDEQKFTEWCYEFETAFPNVENRLHYTPRGDAFTVAKRLCAKYEGEVLQSSPIIASGNTADAGCHDMVLLYSGGNHRELKWNAADCAPNVSYTDENGKEHWLFDSYLFLEIYSGLTDNDVEFAQGYHRYPASKDDWKNLIDSYCQPSTGIGGLNEAIGNAAARIGAPVAKRGVVIGIPQPIVEEPLENGSLRKPWGKLDSGKTPDFTQAADCIEAVKWYIDYAISAFEKMNYDNVELKGFYWIAEHDADTHTIIPVIADHLKSRHYSFHWIPFFGAQGTENWKELRFTKAFLQPNYFFSPEPIDGRLDAACRIASSLGMGMEIEFDERVLKSSSDCRDDRLKLYMAKFREYGTWFAKDIAYYIGSHALNSMFESTDADDRKLYLDFCRFVSTRQENSLHPTAE